MSYAVRAAVGGILVISALGTSVCAEELEEVLVTAQKRSENLRDVPISISAFTATALEERAIGDVSQLANAAPNVSLDAGTPFSGSSNVLSAFIRGIGQNDFAFNLDPGVGIYLDGVYLARSVGANQDLLDVERIEVLKGPQGTLFGRNTIGGAVSIVTRDPGDEFRLSSTATTGSFDRMQLGASADIPFSDALKSSVTVSMKQRKGYMHRLPYSETTPFGTAYDFNSATDYKAAAYDTGGTAEGSDNAWNARVKMKWDNGGAARFTVAADFAQVNQEQLPNKVLATFPVVFAGAYNTCINSSVADINAGIPGPLPVNALLCGSRGTSLNPELLLGSLAGVNVDSDPYNDRLPYDDRFVTSDIDTTYANGNNLSRLNNWGVSGTYDYDLNDNLSIRSITAYRDMHWNTAMDLDGSPLVILQTSFDMNQKQFSEELQLNGSAMDDKVKYVTGLYYFKESGDLHDFVTFSEGFLQVDGPNDLWTRNYAAFAQFDWRVTDLVGLTIGGRYTKENKRFEGFQADLNGLNYKLSEFAGGSCLGGAAALTPASYTNCRTALDFPDPDYALRYYVPGTQKKNFSNFSPKIGVQLHPNDATMVYASYTEGYKTGGWTTRLSNPVVPTTAPDFDQEEAKTYELGVKTQVRNRMNISAAIFDTKYDGIQLNFQQGVSPTIQNAGNAEIKGAEVELTAAVTDAFTVSASMGYLDAAYTKVLPEAQVAPSTGLFGAYGVEKGSALPKTPKTKFNLSPRYEMSVAGGGTVMLIADYTRTSKMRNDTEGYFLLVRPSTDQVNAAVTYRTADRRWDVTLGGTNLTDERFITTGQAQLAGGVVQATYNRPREWYLTVSLKQ